MKPSSAGGKGGMGTDSSALGGFCNVSIKITHFRHILTKIVTLKQLYLINQNSKAFGQ